MARGAPLQEHDHDLGQEERAELATREHEAVARVLFEKGLEGHGLQSVWVGTTLLHSDPALVTPRQSRDPDVG